MFQEPHLDLRAPDGLAEGDPELLDLLDEGRGHAPLPPIGQVHEPDDSAVVEDRDERDRFVACAVAGVPRDPLLLLGDRGQELRDRVHDERAGRRVERQGRIGLAPHDVDAQAPVVVDRERALELVELARKTGICRIGNPAVRLEQPDPDGLAVRQPLHLVDRGFHQLREAPGLGRRDEDRADGAEQVLGAGLPRHVHEREHERLHLAPGVRDGREAPVPVRHPALRLARVLEGAGHGPPLPGRSPPPLRRSAGSRCSERG